ncbi:type II secretion system protein [Bacillus sp. HMF5848]|nr:type II secretion system protein [Bacillus sp. HMF5848]
MLRSSQGLTLIELLAVIVILGIISAIAVPSIGKIIERVKEQAFVANAYAMYEAATMHERAQQVFIEDEAQTLTYKDLVEGGYLDPIQDPFTQNVIPSSNENSFVTISKNGNDIEYAVCLKGTTKQICTESTGTPVESLSINLIENVE